MMINYVPKGCHFSVVFSKRLHTRNRHLRIIMDFQWHFPMVLHCSVVFSKGLSPQWTFTGDVRWIFSGIFQWNVTYVCVHVCGYVYIYIYICIHIICIYIYIYIYLYISISLSLYIYIYNHPSARRGSTPPPRSRGPACRSLPGVTSIYSIS